MSWREYDQVPRDVKPIYSEYVIPFVAFPPECRRVIYTTDAMETLNR